MRRTQSDRITRPNGTHSQYLYEASGLKRLTGVQNRTTAGANQSSFVSGYGNASLKDTLSFQSRTYGAEAPQTVSYNYSDTSMLKRELGSTSVATASAPLVSNLYEYDAMGNRLQGANYSAKNTVHSQHNALNQIASQALYSWAGGTTVLTGSQRYGYDGDGNQTTVTSYTPGGVVNGQTSYAYDDLSRLVSITTPNSTRTEFVYDGLSRLRVTREFTWNGSAWSAPIEKRRVYDGMDVIQERNTANAVTASIARAGNIGGILARSRPTNSNRALHPNHN